MTTREPKEPTFISILGRAFNILEQLLMSEDPIGISELSRKTGIPKANTFRIVKTLEDLNAITPEGSGYVLGNKMIELGAGAKKNNQFLSLTDPFLSKLSETCGETVNLGIPFRDSILIIQTKLSEQRLLVASLPPITPLYCSSIGKIFLAQKNDSELEAYFKETHPRKRTVHTKVTPEQFLQERETIRREKISHDQEEYDYGLSCMAAPIFLNNQLAAAISISGPTSRLQFKGYPQLEKALKATADTLSNELTHKGATLPDIY